MNRYIKLILKTIATIIATILFVLLSLALINLSLFDEELRPEIVEALQEYPMPADEDNALIAAYGISASNDKNVVVSGRQLIERYRYNRDVLGSGGLNERDYDEVLGANDNDKNWLETYARCVSRINYGCLKHFEKVLENSPIESKRVRLLQKRYAQMRKMPVFNNINDMRMTTPLPSYGMIMRVGQLTSVEYYLSDDKSQFLENISVDLIFWRMVLHSAGSVIDKMIATAVVWNDVQFLSEFIANNELSQNDKVKVLSLLTPLTNDEMDLNTEFDAELKGIVNSLISTEDDDMQWLNMRLALNSNIPMYTLYQKNATSNMYYDLVRKPLNLLIGLSAPEFSQYPKNHKKAVKELKNNCCIFGMGDSFSISPSNLYNPTGKMLMIGMMADYSAYIARLHDLNGMIALIKLQLSLQDVPSEKIAESIAGSEFKNLYTGEPMDWDEEANWLSFDCLNTSSFCKVKL